MKRHSVSRPRRALATGAVLAAGALALAACTPSATENGGTADPGTPAANQTISVWHYFSDENQVQILEDYKEIFESANEGVTVENVFVPYDQLNPRLISSAASGSGPDVVVFNGADAGTLASAARWPR